MKTFAARLIPMPALLLVSVVASSARGETKLTTEVFTASPQGFLVTSTLIAGEKEADLEVPRRDERAVNDDRRAGVAAHGVDRDAQALLFDRLYLTSRVIAAVRADLVRELRFVALRTFAAANRLEGVVGAALGGARLRVPPFGIRHD